VTDGFAGSPETIESVSMTSVFAPAVQVMQTKWMSSVVALARSTETVCAPVGMLMPRNQSSAAPSSVAASVARMLSLSATPP
jgi:hypothetical protein